MCRFPHVRLAPVANLQFGIVCIWLITTRLLFGANTVVNSLFEQNRPRFISDGASRTPRLKSGQRAGRDAGGGD